jgi:hypothetical protein
MDKITVGKALALIRYIEGSIETLNRNSTLLLPFATRRAPLLEMVHAIIEKSGSFRLDLQLTPEAEKEFLALAEAYGANNF